MVVKNKMKNNCWTSIFQMHALVFVEENTKLVNKKLLHYGTKTPLCLDPPEGDNHWLCRARATAALVTRLVIGCVASLPVVRLADVSHCLTVSQ